VNKYNYTDDKDDKGVGYLGVVAPMTVGGLPETLAHPYEGKDLTGALGVTLFYIALPFFQLSPFPGPIQDLYSTPDFMPASLFWVLANAFYWIFWLNLMVGITNSLPAVPLDGGYIFRDAMDKVVSRFKKGLTEEQREEYVGKTTVWLAYLILVLILLPLVVPRILGLF